jgi:hypothetical protein
MHPDRVTHLTGRYTRRKSTNAKLQTNADRSCHTMICTTTRMCGDEECASHVRRRSLPGRPHPVSSPDRPVGQMATEYDDVLTNQPVVIDNVRCPPNAVVDITSDTSTLTRALVQSKRVSRGKTHQSHTFLPCASPIRYAQLLGASARDLTRHLLY